MRIRNNAYPLAVSLVLVVSLFGGCAQNKQALRAEDSGVAVRLPPLEAMDVRLRSERPEVPPRPPPVPKSYPPLPTPRSASPRVPPDLSRAGERFSVERSTEGTPLV